MNNGGSVNWGTDTTASVGELSMLTEKYEGEYGVSLGDLLNDFVEDFKDPNRDDGLFLLNFCDGNSNPPAEDGETLVDDEVDEKPL